MKNAHKYNDDQFGDGHVHEMACASYGRLNDRGAHFHVGIIIKQEKKTKVKQEYNEHDLKENKKN